MKYLVGAALLAIAAWTPVQAADTAACHSGAYRLMNGQIVVIGASEKDSLRYRFPDGRTGRLYPDGDGRYTGGPGWSGKAPPVVAELAAASCRASEIQFRAGDTALAKATRLAERQVDSTFEGAGVKLRSRLIAPPGNAKVPLVVLLHGSEDTSAVRSYLDQHGLPAQGIAAFVYDKRGTGESGGKYTQDFELLARDAAAAMAEAKRLLGNRVAKAGYWGGSQAGWIAPLAATKAPADFVVVSFGMAEGPLAEDREEVRYELAKRGYGADVLAKAREVTDATAQIMRSRYQSGYDAVRAVKAKYGNEPWFEHVKGEFTGDLLKYPEEAIRQIGPQRDPGTPWDYEPRTTLDALNIPMLWVLAGDDEEAPSDNTLAILKQLQAGGKPIDVAVYPNTTHGIITFTENEKGERTPTGYARSYQPLVGGWIKSHTTSGAGRDAVLHPRRR